MLLCSSTLDYFQTCIVEMNKLIPQDDRVNKIVLSLKWKSVLGRYLDHNTDRIISQITSWHRSRTNISAGVLNFCWCQKEFFISLNAHHFRWDEKLSHINSGTSGFIISRSELWGKKNFLVVFRCGTNSKIPWKSFSIHSMWVIFTIKKIINFGLFLLCGKI